MLYKNKNKDMVEQWFTDRGKIKGEQVGPDPDEVAQNQLKDLIRLKNFIRRFSRIDLW